MLYRELLSLLSSSSSSFLPTLWWNSPTESNVKSYKPPFRICTFMLSRTSWWFYGHKFM